MTREEKITRLAGQDRTTCWRFLPEDMLDLYLLIQDGKACPDCQHVYSNGHKGCWCNL